MIYGGSHFFDVDLVPRLRRIFPGARYSDFPDIFGWNAFRHSIHSSRYLVYNTEDLEAPGKLSDGYLEFLDGATSVYHYSQANIQFYERASFLELPLVRPFLSKPTGTTDGILFFGMVTPRRAKILDAVGTARALSVVGSKRDLAVRAAKATLSVGAYSNLHNDALRAYPVLEAGGTLVIEQCQEEWFNEQMRDNGAIVVPYEGLVEACQNLCSS